MRVQMNSESIVEETTADARGLGGTAGIELSGDMETDLPLLAFDRACVRRCAVLLCFQ